MIKSRPVLVFILFFIFPATKVFSQKDFLEEIRQYAQRLEGSLGPLQKRTASLGFQDTSRLKWNNLPVGLRARVGLNIGNMSDSQRMLVHRILSASLSSQGYLKATGVMHLDELINRFYDTLHTRKELPDDSYEFVKKLLWSPKNYFFAFFGSPTDPVWSYKLEGHHLSINFTIDRDSISVTPFFIGTDPAEYLFGEYAGWRVLGQEEDLGLKLLRSLDASQQKKAIMTKEAPADIITAAESGKRLVDYWGLKVAGMTASQKSLVERIVREYVYNMEYEKASIEYGKIVKAGLDNIYFGWIGGAEEKIPHYFILNGPTFLIEFDNNGGPRNSANHIHTIWREKGNEYGEDVLKKHYLSEKHN